MRPHQRFLHTEAGQIVVLFALMLTALLAGAGMAVDGAVAFYNDVQAGRAAAAAALSGVVFMPSQFAHAQASPSGSRNDAQDRAIDEAGRNGYTISTSGVTKVSGQSNELRVTVTTTSPTFFMSVLGVSGVPVTRTAIAQYLPPIMLGQPGNQLGSGVSQIGGGGSNYYVLRTEGWHTDRGQGDAFTPNPCCDSSQTVNATDVHQLSAIQGTDTVDPSLPARGGYNFMVTLPAGGSIFVYNAVFGPDNGSAPGTNNCENDKPPPSQTCNTNGASYNLHEQDSFGGDFATPTRFSAMEYTIFQVNNLFIRSQDTKVAQVTVLPINASGDSGCAGWNASPPQYYDVNTGNCITQTYSGGLASNMLVYHNWMDAGTYSGPNDKDSSGNGIVNRILSASGPLPAGTYRLRVDTLNSDGSLPPDGIGGGSGGNSNAHKGYGVAACATGSMPSTCVAGGSTVGGWDDMGMYTPVTGGGFNVPLFQLPQSYAGQTISVDIYDVGDISSSSGTVNISILDNTLTVATSSSPPLTAWDLGTQRNPPSLSPPNGDSVPLTAPNSASVLATTSGGGSTCPTRTSTARYNGCWLHFSIPIPPSYNASINNGYWYLNYLAGAGTTANDTITVAVGLAGDPVHLISG